MMSKGVAGGRERSFTSSNNEEVYNEFWPLYSPASQLRRLGFGECDVYLELELPVPIQCRDETSEW